MADAGTLDHVYDFIPLLRGPAPLHHQLAPRHERGLVRGEIEDPVGDLVGLAVAADTMRWYTAGSARRRSVIAVTMGRGAPNWPGCARVLERREPRQEPHGALGRLLSSIPTRAGTRY